MDVEGGRERGQTKTKKEGKGNNHFRSHGDDDDDLSLSDYLITLDSTPGSSAAGIGWRNGSWSATLNKG